MVHHMHRMKHTCRLCIVGIVCTSVHKCALHNMFDKYKDDILFEQYGQVLVQCRAARAQKAIRVGGWR